MRCATRMPLAKMDDRDDLGDVWGQQEQQAYEQAQAVNVDAIASFAVEPARRGRGQRVEPPAPLAPYVALYRWHRQCYGDYLDERLQDYETESSSAEQEARRGDDEPSSSGGDNSDALRGVAYRDRVREYDGRSSSEPPTDHMSSSSLEEASQRGKRRHAHQAQPSRAYQKRARYGADEEGDVPSGRTGGRHINADECFLCGWGDQFHDGIEAEHANYMHEMIRKRHGVFSNRDLAIALHLYYKERVYDPGRRMPMLTVAVALLHIECQHTLNANIFLGESIRDEQRIAFLLKNIIFRSDGTYDKQALKDYRASIFTQRQLYNMRLAGMNFNQDCTKEDQRPQANYFTLMPPQSNRVEQRRRQERVEKTRDLPTFRLT